MSMLKAHIDAIEDHLISLSHIPGNAGHTIHRGTPREVFIRDYLEKHLSSNVAIGTGEIIDAKSESRQSRRQFDIVIYRRDYPKIDLGAGISAFLIESVIATIEVKSVLDQSGIDQAVGAAHEAKSLVSNSIRTKQIDWMPPKVLNYVIAYTGPAQMQTVHNWMINSHTSLSVPLPVRDLVSNTVSAGTALDGVIVLKKGFVLLDNMPITFNVQGFPGIHAVSNSEYGNLLPLFLILQIACTNLSAISMNARPYLASMTYQDVSII